MVGIYKYTNKINGHSYIGQSIHIFQRKHEHEYRALHPYQGNNDYNKTFYHAIRKYGIENFDFEILQECSEQKLNQRQIYWISYYDSHYNGYNETDGGQGIRMLGESHPNHKLTQKQVYDIRQSYQNHEIKADVEQRYKGKINHSGFSKVWNGSTWTTIHMDVYTEENKKFHRYIGKSHPGKTNGRGQQLTIQQIIDIRTRLLTEPRDEIWKDYKQYFVQKQTFNNICQYKTYKYLII